MAILDVFKKKKKPVKVKKEEKSSEIKIPKKSRRPKKEISKKEEIKPEAPKVKAKISDTAYRILKKPHVTEKATALTEVNQYVFRVMPRANKVGVKKAIESLYGVDVISVKIIKVPKKQRRLGRISGWRKGYKKAIVKIKRGQKIEVLPR